MEMRNDKIERPRAAELFRDLQHRGPVAWSKPGIDHKDAALADDKTDVRHPRHAVVRNNVDVWRDLPQPFRLDERVRRRLGSQRLCQHQQCGKSSDGPERTHEGCYPCKDRRTVSAIRSGVGSTMSSRISAAGSGI